MAFEIKNVYLDTPGHQIGGVENINSFIGAVLPNALTFAGILLLAYAVFGGFLIITSAGNPDGAHKGQQVLTNAIIGFIIIFAAYWIIRVIEILTGINIVSG